MTNDKGTDQPAHLHNLINAFVIFSIREIYCNVGVIQSWVPGLQPRKFPELKMSLFLVEYIVLIEVNLVTITTIEPPS